MPGTCGTAFSEFLPRNYLLSPGLTHSFVVQEPGSPTSCRLFSWRIGYAFRWGEIFLKQEPIAVGRGKKIQGRYLPILRNHQDL